MGLNAIQKTLLEKAVGDKLERLLQQLPINIALLAVECVTNDLWFNAFEKMFAVVLPNVKREIDFLRLLLNHEFPQNRVYGSSKIPQEKGYVCWTDDKGQICKEKIGILGLTEFNSTETPNVTREDVVLYVNEKTKKLRNAILLEQKKSMEPKEKMRKVVLSNGFEFKIPLKPNSLIARSTAEKKKILWRFKRLCWRNYLLKKGLDAMLMSDPFIAFRYLTRLKQLFPYWDAAYLHRAMCLLSLKKKENAYWELSDALKICEESTSDEDKCIIKGLMSTIIDDLRNAGKQYSRAIRKSNNSNWIAYYFMGNNLLSRKKGNRALYCLLNAINSEHYFFRSISNFTIGNTFFRLGNNDMAVNYISAALKECPYYVQALRTRAKLYYNTHEFNNSLEDYRTCISLKPKDKTLLSTLYCEYANVHLRMGMLDLAQKGFQTAISIDDSNPIAHQGLLEIEKAKER